MIRAAEDHAGATFLKLRRITRNIMESHDNIPTKPWFFIGFQGDFKGIFKMVQVFIAPNVGRLVY